MIELDSFFVKSDVVAHFEDAIKLVEIIASNINCMMNYFLQNSVLINPFKVSWTGISCSFCLETDKAGFFTDPFNDVLPGFHPRFVWGKVKQYYLSVAIHLAEGYRCPVSRAKIEQGYKIRNHVSSQCRYLLSDLNSGRMPWLTSPTR